MSKKTQPKKNPFPKWTPPWIEWNLIYNNGVLK